MSKDASDIFPPKTPSLLHELKMELKKEGVIFANTIPGGYHTQPIPRGKYGERSKILEEMLEVEDAHHQSNWIMLILELSDLVGACIGYLGTHSLKIDDLREYSVIPYQPTPFANLLQAFDQFRAPGATPVADFRRIDQLLWYIGCYVIRWNLRFEDVLRMTEATHRAFDSGQRKPKNG